MIDKGITGNPGTYSWTAPPVLKANKHCKVRVVLLDDKGRTIGSDRSDVAFTIEP